MNILITIFALLSTVAPERVDSVMLPMIDIVAPLKTTDSDGKGAYSSTVVGRSALESRHINGVKELSAVVPNFYQPDYGARMTSSMYVRGFGSRIDQPVVGMNIDEMPLLNKNSYDFELFDIDRVQVLRGAQSALYGRNTSGGAVNVYTLSPLTFQGKRLVLDYGNNNNLRLKASHYASPNSSFGWSVALHYSHSDGYFMNRELGEKCDGGDNLAMRLRLQWLPSQGWSVDNSLSIGYADEGGWAYKSYDPETGTLAPVAYNDACTYRRFNVSDGLVVKRFFDNITVSSLTGYSYLDDRMRIDNDFLPLEYFSMGQYQREHSITQEFVFKTRNEGALNFVGGLFGFYKHTNLSAPVRFKQYGINELILKNANENYYHLLSGERELSLVEDNFVIYDDFVIPAYGAAAYMQAKLEIGNLNVEAGIRANYERSTMDYDSRSLVHYKTHKSNTVPYVPLNTIYRGENSVNAFEWLPSFSIAYKADGWSAYVSARKGVKAGGFNTQLFSDILQTKMMGALTGNEQQVDAASTVYKPETNWTYELGTHLSPLADGTLDLSATLFYIDCRNQQLTVFPKGMSTGRTMSNAGKSYSYGVETELSYRVGNFRFNASYGYTHARFIEFISGNNDYAGNTLPFAPRETMSANLAYRMPVSKEFAHRLLLCVGWNGVGRIYWNEENSLSQAFYGTLQASVLWEKRHFGVSVWGKNLLGREYNTFYFRSIGNDFFAQGKPAQFGVSLHVNL